MTKIPGDSDRPIAVTFYSIYKQSFETISSFGRCRKEESAIPGMHARPDEQTRSRLATIVVPFLGMLILCILYIAIRNHGQDQTVDRDPELASALRHNRILCRALTNHSLARVTSIEPILNFSGQRDRSSALYEIVFQTDDGYHYKDRIDGKTGYIHSFYRQDLPFPTRLKPRSSSAHLIAEGITTVHAKLLASRYLKTIGYDSTNLELLHVSPGYSKSVDYMFRRGRLGLRASNILVAVNRKDGGLDQLWLQGAD